MNYQLNKQRLNYLILIYGIHIYINSILTISYTCNWSYLLFLSSLRSVRLLRDSCLLLHRSYIMLSGNHCCPDARLLRILSTYIIIHHQLINIKHRLSSGSTTHPWNKGADWRTTSQTYKTTNHCVVEVYQSRSWCSWHKRYHLVPSHILLRNIKGIFLVITIFLILGLPFCINLLYFQYKWLTLH